MGYQTERSGMTIACAVDHRIETGFVMSSEKYYFVRSSTIKEAVRLGGDVSDMVPPLVVEALKRKLLSSGPENP